MNPLSLALLAVVSASAQDAKDSNPLSPKREPAGMYRMAGSQGMPKSWMEGDVVKRKGIPSDSYIEKDSQFMYCMVNPAADWVIEGVDEKLEYDYLVLLSRVFSHDAESLHDDDEGTDKDDGVLSSDPKKRYFDGNTGVVGFCGNVRSPTPRVSYKRIDSKWWKLCLNAWPATTAGRYQSGKWDGKSYAVPPSSPIVQTLRKIAKSKHEKNAILALNLMEELKGRNVFFARTVSEVLLDPNAPIKVRERAAEVLASVATIDLSGDTLATIWGDKKAPESLRRAALRGYSIVMGWTDSRTGKQNVKCTAAGATCERMRKYLPNLLAFIKEETIEGKDGKDKLTPLGEDFNCVAGHYTRRWQWYVKKKGTPWFEEMRSDEAKGLDQSQPDGKLKNN